MWAVSILSSDRLGERKLEYFSKCRPATPVSFLSAVAKKAKLSVWRCWFLGLVFEPHTHHLSSRGGSDSFSSWSVALCFCAPAVVPTRVSSPWFAPCFFAQQWSVIRGGSDELTLLKWDESWGRGVWVFLCNAVDNQSIRFVFGQERSFSFHPNFTDLHPRAMSEPPRRVWNVENVNYLIYGWLDVEL